MSNMELEQYRGGAMSRGVAKQTGRALAKIEGSTSVAIARVSACADVSVARVDAATAVTQRALQGVAYLTNIEMSLAEACPAAMSRLKMIGDTGSYSLAGIVMDTAFKLRQI